MARVTVEDCIEVVPNRFDLVLLAARRAREISSGSGITIDRDNDKNPVIALREIADQSISVSTLQTSLARHLQRRPFECLEDEQEDNTGDEFDLTAFRLEEDEEDEEERNDNVVTSFPTAIVEE